jgi:hypothetical protein
MNETSCVKKRENGDILLTAGELLNQIAPNGLPITRVVLSRMGVTFRWFADFLVGTESGPLEHAADGKVYRVFRNSGAVFLEEIRGGRFANIVGYSLAEIPNILVELQKT